MGSLTIDNDNWLPLKYGGGTGRGPHGLVCAGQALYHRATVSTHDQFYSQHFVLSPLVVHFNPLLLSIRAKPVGKEHELTPDVGHSASSPVGKRLQD